MSNSNLIISEVMFNSPSGNNEYIELYNKSQTEYIDLSSYRLKYYTSNPDTIKSAGWGTLLPPGGFAVILEGDYNFSSGIYNNLIPPTALKIRISDNAFGSNGMANTTGRSLKLILNPTDTVDYLFYSANNNTGYSDEKIILNNDSSSLNWSNSMRYLGSPGYKNSVSPSLYDIGLTELVISPVNPVQAQQIQIKAISKNFGLSISTFYTVEIYHDINLDSLYSMQELIYSQQYNSIQQYDSVITETTLSINEAGKHNIICRVVYPPDEDTINNLMLRTFDVYPSGSLNKLVINEIMYAPSPGEPEWIEIFNRSDETINIKKCKVSDNSTTVNITNKDKFIYPGKFIILSKDSSISNYFNGEIDIVTCSLPQLNNSGDKIVIKDSLHFNIDSLDYLPLWGGNKDGKSLERIDPDLSSGTSLNWGTTLSIYKGTPGKINSLTPKDNDLRICSMTVPKHGIFNENVIIKVKVKNEGILQSAQYTLKLYNDVNYDSLAQPGELINTKIGIPLFSKDSTEFFISVKITIEGINYFICEIDVSPDDDPENNIAFANLIGVKVNELRNDIVINEIMYAPEAGKPEYIELLNKSTKTINLKNYYITDEGDSVKVILNPILFLPKEYMVISVDSSITTFYNIHSKLIIKNFPSLNNSGDKLFILDSLNRVIDSLEYFPSWGGSKGSSLERIGSSGSSTDSTNWEGSHSKYKGTPGYINSVSEKMFDAEASSFIFNPIYPVKGDTISLKLKIKNKGSEPAFTKITLFEDTDLDSVADIECESIHDVFIPAKDSILISFNYKVFNVQNRKAFYTVVDLQNDEDTTNNYIYDRIEPGIIPKTIYINEIMYSPAGGEPEWVEIFNKSNDKILLKDWTISDVITTPASHKIPDSVYINPFSYLVFTSDSSIFNYHLNLPSDIIRLTLPSLNNTGDGLVIKDNRNITIDTLLFNETWGGCNGASLERISSDLPSTSKNNWGSSIDIEGSTPGRVNSLKVKQHDLSIAGVEFNPRFPVPGDDVLIYAKLKNYGTQNAADASTSYFYSVNNDSLVLAEKKENISIPSGDSIIVSFTEKIRNIQDSLWILIKVDYSPDEDLSNNLQKVILVPGVIKNSIVINEIMYEPEANKPEWIELYNPSDTAINLRNWTLSDIISPREIILSDDDLFLNAGEFLAIASDTCFRSFYPDPLIKYLYSPFGTLGNTGDGVILYDFRKGIVDSVFYNSSWGQKKGYSLERIAFSENRLDSTNWTLSINSKGSTPGKKNSVTDCEDYLMNDLVINEIMFDPALSNSEYIEFYNRSDKTINIGGWFTEDKYFNRKRIIDSSLVVNSGEYFIIAADSSAITRYNLFNYNNKNIVNESTLGLTLDGIITLKDLKNNLIDSVHYSDDWHNKTKSSKKDISLERINPSIATNDPNNWSTSVSSLGGTPGYRNSIYLENNSNTPELSVSPNPFSPDNDGYEDVTIINYRFRFPLSSLLFKVYDNKGRLVKSINSEGQSEAEGSIIYNGNGDDNIPLRMGIYILLAEGKSSLNGASQIHKTVFVVARRLN